MIALPKPKFAETNVPIGISKEDYKDEIIDKQTHVLEDAIDRVSIRDIIRYNLYLIHVQINRRNFCNVFSMSCFYSMFFQLIYPSAVDPAGILMLRSIRKVFELLGIQPESIQFQKEEFNGQNVIDALRNEPQKCPVITAADFTDYFVSQGAPTLGHVMVTAGALKGSEFIPTNTSLANQWFIKCKNSYGNDPTQPGEIQ